MRYQASSGARASACFSPNSRSAFREMIRNAAPPPQLFPYRKWYLPIWEWRQPSQASSPEGAWHITFRGFRRGASITYTDLHSSTLPTSSPALFAISAVLQ